jgi:hypothetical protein
MKIGMGSSDKTCPSAALSTTNPTWLDPGLNPGRRGGKPATNRLSYGAALFQGFLQGKKLRKTALDYPAWGFRGLPKYHKGSGKI